jgi:hypothetical protein
MKMENKYYNGISMTLAASRVSVKLRLETNCKEPDEIEVDNRVIGTGYIYSHSLQHILQYSRLCIYSVLPLEREYRFRKLIELLLL